MKPDDNQSSSLPAPEPATADAIAPQPVSDAQPPQPAAPADPGATPQEAADSDRIEQEWVLKTKQILLSTHNDPFEQARQLAGLRADYMMKRYQKEIKLGE
jgi:hypothetical protein